jgi:iron complex outermembrane receptor protein
MNKFFCYAVKFSKLMSEIRLFGRALTKAIRVAIMFGASATATISAITFAAEEGIKEAERIQVTGSRITRGDLESALPITSISSAAIKATGLRDVAAVIAQMPFNSQGSFIGAAGGGDANHSASGLRGLGAKRTLTLINGKRIAPSATNFGEATNLNLIPLEAVERIDILRDGASSIYGSDAIGGVINIILKRDFEGLVLKVDAGRPSHESGDENAFAITLGTASSKGSSLIILEHREWEGIRYGTRAPVLNADWDTGYLISFDAPEGNYYPLDANGFQNGPYVAGDCPDDRKIPNGNGEICGYNDLEGKNYRPGRIKDSFFGNFTYNITDNLYWQTEVMAMRDTTNTASGSVWNGENGTFMDANNPNNPTNGTAGATDIVVETLLVGVADREADFDSNVYHFGSTLTWELNAGTFEFFGNASRQDINVVREHYILPDKFDIAVRAGLYNPFMLGGDATTETLNSFLHTNTRRAVTTTKSVGVLWNAESDFSLSGGNIAYSVGAEWQDYHFEDKLDRQSSPGGGAFPTFGGNSSGDRTYWAAYGELALPVMTDFTITLASRYDKYSIPDEGQLSSSINARYQALANLVVRASFSQGFRAPGVDDLLSEESLSFNSVTDPIFCDTLTPTQQAGDPFCSNGEQIEQRSKGNSNLKPETSDQFSAGVVWDITESVDLTLDYYNIKINDQVQFLGAQSVVDIETAGLLNAFDPEVIPKEINL